MKKQIVTIALGAVITIGTATTLFAQNGLPTGGYPSVAGGANGNPGFMPVQTRSGKTVQLRTMKVRGHTTILVPMYMSCDVLNVHC
jgi:cytochrome oxidase Cu insertion factor (SCO1/SenC/PrrC family)